MAGDTIIIGNWNDATPAAPAGHDNVKFQKDVSAPPNISAHVPRADTAGTKYGTIIYDGSGNANRYLGGDGAWHAMPAGSLPNGGTTGQVLAKASAADGDVAWANPSGGSGGGSLVLLEAHSLNVSPPVAYVDFTDWLSALYDHYLITLISCIPNTNGVDVGIRLSTDGGATFDAGASYCEYGMWAKQNGDGDANFSNTPSAFYVQDKVSSNAAYGGFSGDLTFLNPGSASEYKRAFGRRIYYHTKANGFIQTLTGHHYQNISPVNAFRIFVSSGEFSSGTVRIYGYAGA